MISFPFFIYSLHRDTGLHVPSCTFLIFFIFSLLLSSSIIKCLLPTLLVFFYSPLKVLSTSSLSLSYVYYFYSCYLLYKCPSTHHENFYLHHYCLNHSTVIYFFGIRLLNMRSFIYIIIIVIIRLLLLLLYTLLVSFHSLFDYYCDYLAQRRP